MMKRKTALVIISFLSVAVLFLGVYAWSRDRNIRLADTLDGYAGEHAFEELYAAVAAMDTALEKCVWASSPVTRATLCAQAYAGANAATAALGALSFEEGYPERMATFLNRTGDYAYFLLRSAAADAEDSDGQTESLAALHETTALLRENLLLLRSDLCAEGNCTVTGEELLRMDAALPDMPELRYDGVWSDGVWQGAEPVMLSGAAEVSEAEAALIAAGFVDVRSNQASSQGRADAEIPVWCVKAGGYRVYVTVQGGQVLQVASSAVPGSAALTAEDAAEKARDFLSAHGYDSMTEVGRSLEGGLLTLSYCYTQDGVVCYPDTVRLSIALDTGALFSFDATAYLSSHTRRELPPAAVSEEEARQAVSGELWVVSHTPAVIASPGGREVLCHEFLCADADGRGVAVYVNAETGEQERILLLLEENGGKAMI